MCFSAQVWAAYHRYVRTYGADISIEEFVELYEERAQDPRMRIPKALDSEFAAPATEAERRIADLIARYNAEQTARLEQELFSQRKRLTEAERKLQSRVTKSATESQRIARTKMDWARSRLEDLRRRELLPRDSRIFPGHYVPVMIARGGRRVILPMRYQCRPAGKPAFYDKKYPGTYNARRDNLEGFWKGQFGVSHGLMVVDRFYENVSRHRVEGRDLAPGEPEENVVLEFSPRPAQPMLVACLWSRWEAPGERPLLSFAAITDEPPAEIAAAGHDRCIIPIKPENIDAWLNPRADDLPSLYRLLDDRDRPFYEHRLAA